MEVACQPPLYPYLEGTREYKPCSACGASNAKAIVTNSLEEGKETVIIECAFCEKRRGCYQRKIKPVPPEKRNPT